MMVAFKAVAVLIPVTVMMATNLHVVVIAVMVAANLLVMMMRRFVAVVLGRRSHGRQSEDGRRQGGKMTFHGSRSLCISLQSVPMRLNRG
ncbi:hypothetical protein HPGCJGGD_0120 [Methylobacterium haplocladii]|nr:hypothetical protein HPGCJGGD_0120 [Methylobacterium haplocladii]